VQSIYPMKAAPSGLKLTTARFYSPLDRPYTQGVTPNIITRQVARPNGEGQIPGQAAAEDFVLKSALEHARAKLGNVAGTNSRTIGSATPATTNGLR
jgi:C-terminal processing protease CtpA/Prc